MLHRVTLLESHPVDVEVPEGAARSVQGALRLTPRMPVLVTGVEAAALAASGYKHVIEEVDPALPADAQASADSAPPSPTAGEEAASAATPASNDQGAGPAEAGATGVGRKPRKG